jgi:hypothetical protein
LSDANCDGEGRLPVGRATVTGVALEAAFEDVVEAFAIAEVGFGVVVDVTGDAAFVPV